MRYTESNESIEEVVRRVVQEKAGREEEIRRGGAEKYRSPGQKLPVI